MFAPLLGAAAPAPGAGSRQWLPMLSPAVEFFVDQSFRRLMGMG